MLIQWCLTDQIEISLILRGRLVVDNASNQAALCIINNILNIIKEHFLVIVILWMIFLKLRAARYIQQFKLPIQNLLTAY